MQVTIVSMLSSYMHAVKNIPPLDPLRMFHQAQSMEEVLAIVQQAASRCQECSRKSVFLAFSIVGLLLHEPSCVPCETNPNKFSAGCILHPDDKKGSP